MRQALQSAGGDRSSHAPTIERPELAAAWASKAEGDYVAAMALNRPRKHPVPGGVCFHCRESAEKYLKAVLVSQGVPPPQTHNLLDLVADCLVLDPAAVHWREIAAVLNPFDETVGYPGKSVSAIDAEAAVDSIRRLRRLVRKKLGL